MPSGLGGLVPSRLGGLLVPSGLGGLGLSEPSGVLVGLGGHSSGRMHFLFDNTIPLGQKHPATKRFKILTSSSKQANF